MRYGFLAAVSFCYLVKLEPVGTCALLIWTLTFYCLAPGLVQGRAMRHTLGAVLILAIVGYLAYFKYIPQVLAAIASDPHETAFLIPLGLSYYTFKLIHYVIEAGRGNIKTRSVQQFLCYIFLLPTFTAGPIERFDHFLREQDDRWSLDSLVQGLTRITYGLIKKFVFADFFFRKCFTGGLSHNTLLVRLDELSTPTVWMYVAGLYLYIYLDFSAYTDIALGAGRLFGIGIMENFDYPVFARNISDFWRRWHMTLSGWCLNYIYMPVLGLFRKPVLAVYVTFAVIGVWHAGTLLRLGWGLYHATGVFVYMTWARIRRRYGWAFFDRGVWAWIGVLITQVFVCSSMVFLVDGKGYDVYGAFRVLGKLIFINLPA